jgi:hypothetical protein
MSEKLTRDEVVAMLTAAFKDKFGKDADVKVIGLDAPGENGGDTLADLLGKLKGVKDERRARATECVQATEHASDKVDVIIRLLDAGKTDEAYKEMQLPWDYISDDVFEMIKDMDESEERTGCLSAFILISEYFRHKGNWAEMKDCMANKAKAYREMLDGLDKKS